MPNLVLAELRDIERRATSRGFLNHRVDTSRGPVKESDG